MYSSLLDPQEEICLSAILFLASALLSHWDASSSVMVERHGAKAEVQQHMQNFDCGGISQPHLTQYCQYFDGWMWVWQKSSITLSW
jgi:hypothetical protein